MYYNHNPDVSLWRRHHHEGFPSLRLLRFWNQIRFIHHIVHIMHAINKENHLMSIKIKHTVNALHFFPLSVQRFNDPRKMHTQHPEPQHTNSTWRQSSFTAHKMPPHDCCKNDAHICMCWVPSIRGLRLFSSLCAPIVLRFDEPEIVRTRIALLRLLTRPIF